METKEFNKYINIISHQLNLQLSDEQLTILRYNYQTPVRLNACAGAGKTTLLVISILLQILDGKEPHEILAITFSKKAQLDMQAKFMHAINQLGISMTTIPTFNTFDALFLHMYRTIVPNVKIMPNYGTFINQLNWQMKQSIVHKPNVMSEKELLKHIKEFRDQLISNQKSYNGLTLKNATQPATAKTLERIGNDFGNSYSSDFYENYVSVITTYNQMKDNAGYVDFNDLKLKLFQRLAHSQDKQLVDAKMQQYQICFIDEFQDINALQWHLINKLLPQVAKDHLVAIGDDDQSIYTFRGSNPNIIMHLADNIANLKTFNLTTNYRTAGNVLTYVRPMIQKNQYRLDKPLNIAEHKKDQGYLVNYVDSQYISSGEALLNQVLSKLQDSKVNNQDVAILCRNNIDIAIAGDYLANHGQYVNVNRSINILQRNPFYASLLSLIAGLALNSFEDIKINANKLGFGKYQQHIQAILATHHVNTVQNTTQYLAWAAEYDRDHLNLHQHQDYQLYQKDIILSKYVTQLRNAVHNHDEQIGTMVYKAIHELTKDYFKWMLDHKFQDEFEITTINEYLKANLHDVNDLNNFFDRENKKLALLSSLLDVDENPDTANIMTIHQSKGLEFKYVFLYNMRANQVNEQALDLDEIFNPDMDKQTFADILLNQKFDDYKHSARYSDLYYLADDLKHIYRRYARQSQQQVVQFMHDLCNGAPKLISNYLVDRYDTLYQLIINTIKLVEDERRLLYVALTRSIDYAAFNSDGSNATPLLGEIELPVDQIEQQLPDGTYQSVDTVYQQQGFTMGDLIDFQNKFN